MLTVLLESRAARPRHIGGTLFSTFAHGTLIATIVALTLPNRGSARSAPDVHPAHVTYVRTSPTPARPNRATAKAPSTTGAPQPSLPTVDVPIDVPTRMPLIDLSATPTSSDRILIGGNPRELSSGAEALGTAVSGAGGVSDVGTVDRAPRIIGRALEPRYPAALRSAGVQGNVLAEFVVDTLGRVELASLRFPELANPLLGDAVREALAQYRFMPGEIAGRKVRTRVAVPFEFRLER